MRNFIINSWLVVISAGAMIILCELSFRKVLFSDWKFGASLREPGAYADIYDDKHSPIFSNEYWVLYYKFDQFYKPPDHPHPLLGWVGKFDSQTYLHDDYLKIDGRIPVLLFGDSFSICVGSKCFEDILNEDSTFASKYYFLNYGVGGYGVDQIYLLSRQVIPLYDNPIIFFGLMTRDLDRNILNFRTGQKPFFEILDEKLVLSGIPIDADVAHFVEHHMPDINSYLYRYFRNSYQNYIPESHSKSLTTVKKIIQLNESILSASNDFLKDDVENYRFLVFSALYQGEFEWRNKVVREELEKMHAPYIWVKDLIESDSNYNHVPTGFYEDATNGHPTTYQNMLICEEIKRCLFDSTYNATIDSIHTAHYASIRPSFDPASKAHYLARITKDAEWMKAIVVKAEEKGISADSMLSLDCQYMADEYLRSHPN